MPTLRDNPDLPEDYYQSTFDNLSKIAMLPSYYRAEAKLGVMEGRIISLDEDLEAAVVYVTPSVCVFIPFSEMSYRGVMTAAQLRDANYVGKHVQFVITQNTGTRLIGSRRAHQSEVLERLVNRVASKELGCFNAIIRQVTDKGAFAEYAAGILGRISFSSSSVTAELVRRSNPVNSKIRVATALVHSAAYGTQLLSFIPEQEAKDLQYVDGCVMEVYQHNNSVLITYGIGAVARIDRIPKMYQLVGAIVPNVLILNRHNSIGLVCPEDRTPDLSTAFWLLEQQHEIPRTLIHKSQWVHRATSATAKLQGLILLRICKTRVTTSGLMHAWLSKTGHRYSAEEVYCTMIQMSMQKILNAQETVAVDAMIKQLQLESYIQGAEEVNCSVSFTLRTVTHIMFTECIRRQAPELREEMIQTLRMAPNDRMCARESLVYINKLLSTSDEFRKELLRLPLTKMVRFSDLSTETLLRLLLEEIYSIYEDWAELKFTRTPSLQPDQQLKIYSAIYGTLQSGERHEVVVFISQSDVNAYTERMEALARSGRSYKSPKWVLSKSGLDLSKYEQYETPQDNLNIF